MPIITTILKRLSLKTHKFEDCQYYMTVQGHLGQLSKILSQSKSSKKAGDVAQW